ncbi:unnamed protein product [Bemisia tabaci]|uniref:Uncharacterized protein n=1 Tax=Bemisia tabaci TaxID=7038 RepID=A0A9P0F6H7_BEMTA|nr:unnamed protein product [Bemisia tabaci]
MYNHFLYSFGPTVFVVAVLALHGDLSHPPQIDQNQELLTFLAFKLCENTIHLSQQALFYVVDLGQKSSGRLTQLLHDNLVKTVLINHHSKLNRMTANHDEKNIIFFLENIDEVFSIMFDSFKTLDENKGDTDIYSNETLRKQNNDENHLQNYCVEFLTHLTSEQKTDHKCDFELRISSEELEDQSTLSDQVFEATYNFRSSNVWNCRNYLIIMLNNVTKLTNRTTNQQSGNSISMVEENYAEDYFSDDLILYFRFFWRFLKSYKAVICHSAGCVRYDPFTDIIHSYKGSAGEPYFDFTLRNLHRKSLGKYTIYTP